MPEGDLTREREREPSPAKSADKSEAPAEALEQVARTCRRQRRCLWRANKPRWCCSFKVAASYKLHSVHWRRSPDVEIYLPHTSLGHSQSRSNSNANSISNLLSVTPIMCISHLLTSTLARRLRRRRRQTAPTGNHKTWPHKSCTKSARLAAHHLAPNLQAERPFKGPHKTALPNRPNGRVAR